MSIVSTRTKDWLMELVLFVGTVLLAWVQKWSADDLVWSLWISSLTLGYSYILVSIAGMFAGQLKQATAGESVGRPNSPATISSIVTSIIFLLIISVFTGFSFWATIIFFAASAISIILSLGKLQRKKGRWLFMPSDDNKVVIFFILLPYGLFMVGFFTLHFLGFHFVHALFLNGFFPLNLDSASGTGNPNEFVLFKNLVYTTIKSYWIFICASAMSRLGAYRTAFQRTELGPSVGFAYTNIARMHLLIFIIGFMSAAGLQRFFLYAILFLYFFPFDSLLFQGLKKKRSTQKIGTP